MQFLKKVLSALLVAAMALVMLTACVPSGSEPPASSTPGDSQGSTVIPGGDAETPDETPDGSTEQKITWLTSKTRAYFKQRGVTATNFFVDTGTISIEMNYGLKYGAKLVTWYLSDNDFYGFLTNGSDYYYYETSDETGELYFYELNNEFAEIVGAQTVANMIYTANTYLYNMELRLKVIDDTADRVVAIQAKEYENGYYAETITLADGWTYVYTYNTLGELIAITSSSTQGDAAQTYMIKKATQSDLAILM